MDDKIKYLAALAVFSLMSILLATEFVDALNTEKSVGGGANGYEPSTSYY